MRQIPLLHCGVPVAQALVDDADYTTLSRYRWSIRSGYAIRYFREDDRIKRSFMHREIFGLRSFAEHSVEVDHLNHDRVDNRRANLRVLTGAQNRQNAAGRPGSSRFRGVSFHKPSGLWFAYVKTGGRTISLGYHRDEDDAGKAAVAGRAKHLPFSVEAAAA